MDSRRFGFIGLGTMGGAMALRLVEAGYALTVLDSRPEAMARLTERGAATAATPAAVANAVDVVFLSLPTPDVVEAVVAGPDGVAAAERPVTVIDLSTTGSFVERRIAAALAAAGKVLVDCPISGGAEGARSGTLALMAAGPQATLDALAPVLKVFGTCYPVGDTPGQGQILKVINNLMSTAALAITSEALVLGVKAGLNPDRMLDAINASSGRNTASTSKFPKHVLPRTFDFGMPIKLSAKDAKLCLDEAERLGVPMIVGTAVRQLLTITCDHLGGGVDMTSVVRVVEEWAKVEVRGGAGGT